MFAKVNNNIIVDNFYDWNAKYLTGWCHTSLNISEFSGKPETAPVV